MHMYRIMCRCWLHSEGMLHCHCDGSCCTGITAEMEIAPAVKSFKIKHCDIIFLILWWQIVHPWSPHKISTCYRLLLWYWRDWLPTTTLVFYNPESLGPSTVQVDNFHFQSPLSQLSLTASLSCNVQDHVQMLVTVKAAALGPAAQE